MKARIKSMAAIIAAASMVIIYSCEKDVPKPVINLTELGYENSKTVYAGSDLHIEAEIVAEGKIDKVTIEIHPEGEHAKGTSATLREGIWEVDTTYTKFSGLKNTTFHEHIDIPVCAEPGHYHFHFTVTDMEGNQTTVEEELEIQQPSDAVAPGITISAAPTGNQHKVTLRH